MHTGLRPDAVSRIVTPRDEAVARCACYADPQELKISSSRSLSDDPSARQRIQEVFHLIVKHLWLFDMR
jgi:hypothetical protein